MKFQLFHEALMQGNFELKEINVAYVFQVNCPGCFIYGIPMVNNWYQQYKESVGFIGISTCFEDFELNTPENTRNLLTSGQMVGETLKYFANHQVLKYDHPPIFPVAFDKIIATSEYLTEENIASLCSTFGDYENWTQSQKLAVKTRLVDYYSSLPKIAKTFSLNQLRGTPSYVIFDNEFTIRHSLFGHLSSSNLESYLKA